MTSPVELAQAGETARLLATLSIHVGSCVYYELPNGEATPSADKALEYWGCI